MKVLDKMHKEVLERILALKEKHNLSDKEFGIKAGVGEKAIDNWKRGLSASYMKKLDILANFFNVSTDYLLTGNGQKEKPPVNGDEELTKYLQYLKTRPEMRMLFDITKSATKEDVEKAVKIIEAFLKKE